MNLAKSPKLVSTDKKLNHHYIVGVGIKLFEKFVVWLKSTNINSRVFGVNCCILPPGCNISWVNAFSIMDEY